MTGHGHESGYGTFVSAEVYRATRVEDLWSDVLIFRQSDI
jgi:hypothetical protein